MLMSWKMVFCLVCGMEGDEEASGGFDATIGLLGYLKFSNEIYVIPSCLELISIIVFIVRVP